MRFEVASTAATAEVRYGSNSDSDVDLDDQRMPFAVEVTVPTDTGYVYVDGSDYGSSGGDSTLRCRVYVNDVLVGEELSHRGCIVGVNVASVFTS